MNRAYGINRGALDRPGVKFRAIPAPESGTNVPSDHIVATLAADSIGSVVEAARDCVRERSVIATSDKYRDSSFCRYDWSSTLTAWDRPGYWTPEYSIKDLAERISSRIDSTTESDSLESTIEFDVTGQYLDIGRVLTGEPECWGSLEAAPVRQEVVRVVLNMACSYGVHARALAIRGAAVAALIDRLQREYIVELELVSVVSKSTGMGFSHLVKIAVDLDNEYGMQQLEFALLHAGFYRRLVFALREYVEGKDDLGNYGTPGDLKAAGDVYYFGPMRSSSDGFDSIDEAIDTVNRMLAERRNAQ